VTDTEELLATRGEHRTARPSRRQRDDADDERRQNDGQRHTEHDPEHESSEGWV